MQRHRGWVSLHAPVPHANVSGVNARLPLYVEESDGGLPAVVFLHHGMGSLRAWDRFLPSLADGRRSLRYDRRGFGRSPRDTRYGAELFDEDVEDLHNLLRERAVGPAHLVGHSDGATVALMMASRHPEAVLSVTAVANHVRFGRDIADRLLARGFPEEWGEKAVRTFERDHGDAWRQVCGSWYALLTSGPLDSFDIEQELASIRCAVLVVHDLNDPLSPPEHALSVERRVRDATVSWYEFESHAPHAEDPDRFAREVHRLWARVERPSE